MNPGYVFVPYILVKKNSNIIVENMPKRKISSSRYVQTVASRYGTFKSVVERRIKKIKKILQKLEDLKNVT